MSALPQSPLIPLPVAADTLAAVERLAGGLDAAALHWLSGYFAGRAATAGAPAPAVLAEPRSRLTILYASHTGNARRIAERLKSDAESAGLAVRLFAADTYPQRELASERLLSIVASTHGDGEPPDAARGLFDFLLGRKAPKLAGVKYSVLALGDSSYPKFCEAGRVLDRRLAELGGERAGALVELDLDFEAGAATWRQLQLEEARRTLGATAPALRVVPNVPAPVAHDRTNPFTAELLVNQRLTTAAGWRDVRHLELSLAGSGLRYEPGDALGVVARNSAPRVARWLEHFGIDCSTIVQLGGRALPVETALREHRELTRLSRGLLQAIAQQGSHAPLSALLADPESLARTLRQVSPIDLLRQFPARLDAQALIDLLRPLTPRLYSIASSQATVGDEVHLTVAIDPEGVASGHLGDLAEGGTVPVFIEPNARFRLPTDPARDIILVGPGTGVAPFRGFLQQRIAQGATGRNWLFFGAPRLREDFLYQREWLDARAAGKLQLDVAFSRDATPKAWVQHRLRERARSVHDWLEGGAHVYVCGDAARMAPDVHETLVAIVGEQGGLSREDAAERVNGWLNEGRYARDVY